LSLECIIIDLRLVEVIIALGGEYIEEVHESHAGILLVEHVIQLAGVDDGFVEGEIRQ
jgi:hypothetical protein